MEGDTMKISDIIEKIKSSEIIKLIADEADIQGVERGTILGFRVKAYDIDSDSYNFYDFSKNMVKDIKEITEYINSSYKNMNAEKLHWKNGILQTDNEANGTVKVLELKDQNHILNVLLPVIRVCKIKEAK